MAKKRGTSRKPARKKRRAARSPRRADRSQLDLKPLQDHIRRRIKYLEAASVGAAEAGQDDDTKERLKNALQMLEDICFPTMGIPI